MTNPTQPNQKKKVSTMAGVGGRISQFPSTATVTDTGNSLPYFLRPPLPSTVAPSTSLVLKLRLN
jgi:hypothetical protein